MTADPFTAFLHHNYPPFFSSIGEVSRLADYFSEADLFLKVKMAKYTNTQIHKYTNT
jgi:hypothetical protein